MPHSSQWITETQGALPVAKRSCRFVARQPIVDRMRRTFGYELLFRSGWENSFSADGEEASRQMLDNAVNFGLDSIVGQTVPFVNCTRSLLLNRMPTVLQHGTVLEVLEGCEVDAPLIAACRELGMQGYGIALDDYDFTERWEMLIPFANYIKLDFRASTRAQRSALMYRLKYHGIRFVAEKVESDEEFRQALTEGFHLFQGYYFMRPMVMARQSPTAMINKLRFLAELSVPELNRSRVLQLLKEEPSISYRLLRSANSAAAGVRDPVKTLECALSLIGEEHFRRLAMLALATEFSGGEALEPIRCILQRARTCELLGEEAGMDPGEMYLFGMISALRKSMQVSCSEIAGSLRMQQEIRSAFDGECNRYRMVLELSESCEHGRWEQMEQAALALRIPESRAAELILEAHGWVADILKHAGKRI